MKMLSNAPVSKLSILLLSSAMTLSTTFAAELTPQQMAVVQKQLSELRDTMDGKISQRNMGAGDIFMNASKDPKAAVALYLKCYQEVNYERENRKESEFRAWKESQDGRLSDPAFVEALQIQLRYLAISCKAAEVEDFAQVFTPLMEFVDGLSRLEEAPDGMLMQSVGGTVFAETYYLERLLAKNEQWEQVAYNIEGIYNKAILPYLRKEKPEALMNAWDRRIEQQTRLVAFLEEQNQKELRGKDRDQELRIKNRQNNRGGVLKAHDAEKFARETLPRLKWAKSVDYYRYIDEVMGAKGLLDYVSANMANPLAEEWLEQLEGLFNEKAAELETSNAGPDGLPATPTSKPVDPNGFE